MKQPIDTFTVPPTTDPAVGISNGSSQTITGGLRFQGRRAGMVTFSPYPVDPRPRRAAETLIREGMTVDLICMADKGQPLREQHGGLNILRIPIANRRGGKLAYAYQYFAFILISALIFAARSLRGRYHLIHVHNMPDVLVASSLVPKLFGAKVILDLHDPMPELMTTIFGIRKDSLAVRIMERLEKWSIARADLVVTVNLACKRIFSGRSCRADKIHVVMNSPDQEIFPFRKPCLRMSGQGAACRPFVIMYHGSLVERNGLDLAVEAFSRVYASMPQSELRIYGRSTPFLEKVMDQVRAKGLEHCVLYMGPRPLEGLVEEIDSCDVGVIPNQRNDFTEINTPTRIFEYLALGKPVIAPRAIGIQDYFDNGSMIFFELGNAADLGRQMEYAYSHSSEALKTAVRGQEVYLEHRWSSENQRYKAAVASLLAELA